VRIARARLAATRRARETLATGSAPSMRDALLHIRNMAAPNAEQDWRNRVRGVL